MDIQACSATTPSSLLSHVSKGIPKDDLHPARARLRRPGLRRQRPHARRCCATCSRCSTTAASAAPATCRSCRSTRASSTRRRRRSRPNPKYFDPENIVELAIEGGCNAVATDLRRARHRVAAVRPQDPVHREAQPQRAADLPEQVRPDHVRHRSSRPTTSARPASAPRSTSARDESHPPDPGGQPRRSHEAHELGMFTVLWCYLRNNAFKKDGVDYHAAADLTGQANHLGVTIEADIIKQKLPENNGGYNALKGYGKTQQARLRRAHHRPPDRPQPLPGGELLHGPHRPDQLRRRVEGRRATSPRPCAPRSSTSGPAAPGLITAARRSSGRWPRASSCSTPSRTSTSTTSITVA